ncbi:unnamed protein product [Hyaloperonospora brassicae]|uniref:Syntaxin N-terminal domain-containing protein n=1 Tax=Hyaloperonospora brassicae TaxID=162125 RepID=A0AAV0UJS3_HYABA|nr:unnamed protein product [Hyaloperonospora brassicae]
MTKAARDRSTPTATEQAFGKLKVSLAKAADSITQSLKTLKRVLGKYDRRRGAYLRQSSYYSMRSDIRVAKSIARDLRYVARRISTSKSPTMSEIKAARMSTNAAVDAMNDLKQSGRIYDQNQTPGDPDSLTSVIDTIMGVNDSTSTASRARAFDSGDGQPQTHKSKRGLFGHKRIGRDIFKAPDTVEGVMASTLHESLSEFAALKQQIAATESVLLPSFATRAKEAVVDIVSSLTGEV